MRRTHRPGLTRRGLLQGLAATGGLAAFGGAGIMPRLAHAQAHPDAQDRHYIFCYFGGGWDILLGLDPRDPAVFTNENLRTTRIQPGYELLQSSEGFLVEAPNGMIFGPHIGDLVRHADKMSVIRGMSMETLTHEVGRRRFITGKAPSGLQARGSSAVTWLADRLGSDQPVPNLSMRVEGYNKGLADYASPLRVNSTADLLRSLTPGAGAELSPAVDRQVDALLANMAQCPGPRRAPVWRAAEGGRLKAREMVGQGLDTLFDFESAQNPDVAALRDRYGIIGNGGNDPARMAAFAAQAIMGGVSRCVSVQITSGLDTHFENWETDQGTRQQAGFDAIARLVDHLYETEYGNTGTRWLDHTIIVGFSEFSRTAMINDRGGRDHSLTNACFLMGGPIQSGIIGRSSDIGLEPTATNLQTGLSDAGGEVIRPEHVLQTLFEDVGIGAAPDLRVSPIQAMLRR
ncbi:MAG: DUF1501 domain-containing protein [Bradymonadia bacterium]